MGLASIFIGCESPTDGAAGAPGKGFGVFTGASSSAAIQAAVDSGAEVYLDGVTIGEGKLDLKTATVRVFGALKSESSADVFVIADKANIIFAPGAEIDFDTGGLFIGTETQLEYAKTGSSGSYPKLVTDISDVGSGDVVALENFTLPASYTNFAGTAYVYGTLTVASDSTAPSSGTIVAIGNVALSGTVTVLSDGKVDVSKATLVSSAEAKVTLPAAGTVAAIDATGVFTVAGADTSLTVGKLTGTLALPSTVTAVTITSGPGSVTLAGTESGTIFTTASFGNTGTTTFGGAGTLGAGASFGGDVVLTAAKALLLAGGQTLTLASGKSVKVGDSVLLKADGSTVLTADSSGSASVTPAAATADDVAKLSLGGADITLTSGEIIVAGDAELELVKTLTVDKTITNAGTITIGADGALWLTGADDGGARLTGTGKLVANKTEITGEWQAVDAGSVSITAAGGTASIAGSESVFKAGEGGVITQQSGANNNLTIEENTTIALGGDATTPVGSIILIGDSTAANGGKITLAATTTKITGDALATGTTAVDAGSVTIANVIDALAGSISGNAVTSGNTLSFLAGSTATNTLVGTVSSTAGTATINAATVIYTP
jgi:hypothetical protein